MDYYENGQISQFNHSRGGKAIDAVVMGSESYHVQILLGDDDSVEYYACSCPAFAQYDGACKHIIAVLLKYHASEEPHLPVRQAPLRLVKPDPVPKADARLAYSHSLVAAMLEETVQPTEDETIHIQVTLHGDSIPTHYISMQMGLTRLYVVKSIEAIPQALINMSELHFGQSFTFKPERQHFLPQDQPFIELLLEAYRDEVYSGRYNYSDSPFKKNYFYLKPSLLRRFLEIAAGMENVLWQKGFYDSPVRLQVSREPLPIKLRVAQGPEGIELLLQTEQPLVPFSIARDIFRIGDRFFLPPVNTIKPLFPVLDAFAKVSGQALPLSDEDAVAFIVQAVPLLEKSCQVEITPEVNARLRREPLNTLVWLDKDGSGISAEVHFRYGDMEINPLAPVPGPAGDDRLLIRASKDESEFLNLLSAAGFKPRAGRFILDDEERIFDFLSTTLSKLLETSEVYRSAAFDSLRLKRPPRLSGAVRLNETTDLLEVSLQMDDLPQEELLDFLAALREKRKFFRMRAGSFIPLDQPETLAAGKLLDQLGLTGNDLKQKLVAIPKYRALSLEHAVQDYGREHFDLNPAFKQLVQAVKEPRDMEWELPRTLAGVLRDYQKTGFKWLKTLSYYGFGGILADDMGLGKTLQIIALVLSEYPGSHRPSLVIAPTSLVYNWKEEIARFAPELPVLVVEGTKAERMRLIKKADAFAFVLTSYPLIRRDVDELKRIRFAYCFVDEAQQIKNPETINAKSVKQISAGRYFALTGTPIENSLTELWSIFDFVMPGYLYSHHQFQARFENPIVKDSDPDALEDLGQHIRPFILRRLKKDVLAELPEKIETKISCEMTGLQRKVYLTYLSRTRAEFEEEVQKNGFAKSRIKILALLTRLRQICCHPALFLEDYQGGSGKLELLRELIGDSLAGGHRILIFSQFTAMLEIIQEQLRRDGIQWYRIDGQTQPLERLRQVHQFNNGGAPVFLISLKAGGTGLNLTGADTVIHYDPWWNPAAEDQATDRAYRIGQTNTVQVFKMVTHGTIEEKIFALKQQKKELVEAVIQPGADFLNQMTLAEIRELFED